MALQFKKKQKSDSGKKLFIVGGALAVLIIAVVLIVADIHIYQKKEELKAQIQALQNRVGEINNSNKNLQEGIDNANNPVYIEKVAREELDLQKPGEKVFSFVQDQNNPAKPQETPKTPWQNFLGSLINGWSWFKSKF